MSTLLVYTIAAYTPFTKILSSNSNQDKADIQRRLNWSGTPGDATTGLSGDNLQSQSAVAEVKAHVTTQGVTLTAITGYGASGNNITITFTSGGVAGSEVVTVSGLAITVQVSSGVSTVSQVVAALNATSSPSIYYVLASGSGSSTVSAAAAVNLASGVTAGGLQVGTKLQLIPANYAVYGNSSGVIVAGAALPAVAGGTGLNIVPTNQNPGDVIQVSADKSSLILGAPTSVPSSLRLFQFFRFS